MRKEYGVDEFIGVDTNETTIADEVDKKVSMLYDFCVLKGKRGSKDEREKAVRELLGSYTSVTEIDNAVRDVIISGHSIDEMLKRKGITQ